MPLRWILAGILTTGGAFGQGVAPAPASVAAKVVDADADVAQTMIGRALILRGFYAANELSFDARGSVEGAPKVTDWTLAAMDVQKVERKGPEEIELDGVRVAIRFNPDSRLFERHAQKDEKMKVMVADAGDPKRLQVALAEIFSTGIDLRLQQSMPDYWAHYFNPAVPWGPDGLQGKAIAGTAAHPFPPDAVQEVAEKKNEPKFTAPAMHDHVRGSVQVRMAVDESGTARRIAIQQPLGYGLDAQTVDAVKQWRFRPATEKGKPIPSAVLVNQTFDYAAQPPL